MPGPAPVRSGYVTGMTDMTTERRPCPPDGRAAAELRPGFFVRDFTEFAAGSVLAVTGRTKVLCTASIDEDVPQLDARDGTRLGHRGVLAPTGSSPERVAREATEGDQSGRTHEIQRLIGRALRSVTDLVALGERQILLDCDVLQADGGTRTAAISGAYIALHDACSRLCRSGAIGAASAARGVRRRLGRDRRRSPACSTLTTPRTPRPKST